jgi:hypothetical protein
VRAACGGLDDLRVTQQVEDGDAQTGRHLEQRQVAGNSLDLDPMSRPRHAA